VSDLALVLNPAGSLTDSAGGVFMETPSWRDVLATFAAGTVPHSWAMKAPLQWHGVLLDAMTRLYLCDNGRGDDGCKGCEGWSRNEKNEKEEKNEKDGKGLFFHSFRHPDLIVVGEFDKAGNVEACRGLIKELQLTPVEAKRRVGVVLAADRLLPHAANSLLKTAEEPPPHANLFFLMEGDDFLPTLRSRSRFTTLADSSFVSSASSASSDASLAARPMPQGEEEWLEWLKNLKGDEDIPELLSSWVSYFLRAGEEGFEREFGKESGGEFKEFAARVERLRLLVLQKKLSQTMVCDLLILALKEDLLFEHILGGFR
jgi:DNA polymerase-3 subunit delta'